jgi:hypothetical protein
MPHDVVKQQITTYELFLHEPTNQLEYAPDQASQSTCQFTGNVEIEDNDTGWTEWKKYRLRNTL